MIVTSIYGPLPDPAYEAWLDEMEEREELLTSGRLTELMHCYLCHLELTGTPTMDPDIGPLRGIVKRGTTPGFDPYASYTLNCGHTLI